MKKLLLLTLAIVTLTSLGYSQTTPSIQRGGIVVYEKDGHGLVAAPTDLGELSWNNAKKACATLTLNGYSDWRLPSREELNSLYENRSKIGGFGYLNWYWSSAEYDDYFAWGQGFNDAGAQNYGLKFNGYNVRAVRAF